MNIRALSEVCLEKAIVHILDLSHDEPVLNDYKLELDDEVSAFLSSHLSRAIRDEDAKTADFGGGVSLVGDVADSIISVPESDEVFVRASKDLAVHLFRCMRSNGDDVPSCDLVICLFTCEGQHYLALLKLDYTRTYIHNTLFEEGRFRIAIVPQHVGLPGIGQRLQKCAFIGPNNMKPRMLVIDKPSPAFWTTEFLGAAGKMDSTDRTKKFKGAVEEWTRKELAEDAGKAEELRSTVVKALRTGGNLNVQELSETVLKGNPQMKESLISHLAANDVSEEVEVDSRWVEQKVKKVKIRTDCGIDVSIPVDIYDDSAKFKMRKNGNGTIDIVILGVRQYKQS